MRNPLPIALVLLLAACGSEESARTERPVRPASPAAAPSDLPAGPGDVPTGDAPTYSKGNATVELSGDVSRTLELPLAEGLPATFAFGVISGAWGTVGGEMLTIAGSAKVGENTTGKQLLLFVSLSEPPTALTSGPSCTVTIDSGDVEKLSGSFDCPGMTSGTTKVDAKGTFSASA